MLNRVAHKKLSCNVDVYVNDWEAWVRWQCFLLFFITRFKLEWVKRQILATHMLKQIWIIIIHIKLIYVASATNYSEMEGWNFDAPRVKSNFAQFFSLILVWHLEWWDSRNLEVDFPLDSPTSALGLNCQTFSKRMNIFGNHRPCERWQKWFPEQFHFWRISPILKMAPLKVAAHRPIGRNYR